MRLIIIILMGRRIINFNWPYVASQTQWDKTSKDKDNDVRSLFKSCPRAFLASQHGVFVPRDSLAAKGLSLLLVSGCLYG